MSIREKLLKFQKNVVAMKDDQKAEMMGVLKGAILAVVALVIIVVLGTALLPASIDQLNGVNATSHPSWTAGTISMWNSISIFVVLIFLLILVAILFVVLRE